MTGSVKMGDLNLTQGQPKGSETILSEEVWEKILMQLTDPSDVLNAGKTCIQFQRILGSKMVEANLAKTLPFLMNYMDAKSVLKCRSVSKGWMGVVDNFFENYFLGTTILKPSEDLRPFPVTRNRCALYPFGNISYNGDHKYEHFIREMKDHPRNPFIGRAVHFTFSEVGDCQDFRRVYNFFEIFGKHIWTLELNMPGRFPIEIQREDIFPFMIRDVYELAPNLKNLYIKGTPSKWGAQRVSMNENEIRELALLPALEKLEISEAFDNSFRNELKKAILLRHSNSQLRVLHTKTLDHLRNLNYPNLKELHFTNIQRISQIDDVFRHLRLPKLELLSIALEKKEKGQTKAFQKFFLALQHICTSSPNLKTLRFGSTLFWNKKSDQPLGFPRDLRCPENIKTLEILDDTGLGNYFFGMETFNSNYSFLDRFPHIENIHIYRDVISSLYYNGDNFMYNQSEIDFENEIIQVHKFMYRGKMYDSNIWEMLPKLKVFSFGERIYTRSSYERLVAKGKLQFQD